MKGFTSSLKFLGGRHGKFNWSLDFLRRLQEPIGLGVFNVELERQSVECGFGYQDFSFQT